MPELPEEAELRRGLRFRPKKERVMPARPPSPLVTLAVSVARVEERVERVLAPGWGSVGLEGLAGVAVVFMCDGVRLREVRDMVVRSRQRPPIDLWVAWEEMLRRLRGEEKTA